MEAMMSDIEAQEEIGGVANGWMPIETVRTTGEWVLIYEATSEIDPRFSRCEVARAHMGDDGLEWFTGEGDQCNPTHWQPLPAPPIPQTQDKEA